MSSTTRSRSATIPVRCCWYASSMMRRMRCQSAPVMVVVFPSPRLPATHAPPRCMVLPAPQVGQANPPVRSEADADRSPRRSVDHHFRLMLLSGYIVESDALDLREEDLQVGEAGVIGH